MKVEEAVEENLCGIIPVPIMIRTHGSNWLGIRKINLTYYPVEVRWVGLV